VEKYIITTDNTSDLPLEFIKENDIDIHYLYYSIDDVVYGQDNQMDVNDFYKAMRSGKMPTTMGTNPDDSYKLFLKRIEQGYSIIHIAFSSGLSTSYNSAEVAKQMILEKYPTSKITIIDSLAASMGEGLLVYKAVQLQKAGASYEEVVNYIEENKLHLAHRFTVDDLGHLYRGGRVSRATAIIGTLASIKPLLHVDDEGHLINIGKVRGRKKSLSGLVDAMEKTMGSYKDKNDIVFISHGDCLEDAKYVGELITKRLGITNIVYNLICPTIASHSGPGTVALFFLAEQR